MDTKMLEAAAIAAALTPARLAGLHFPTNTALMPATRIRHYLHAPSARLLIVPAIASPSRSDLEEIVRAHDADALVALAGSDDADDITYEIMLRSHTPVLARSLRLFLGAGASCHFAPAQPCDTTIALLPIGLRGCEVAPWENDTDRQIGVADGRALLARNLGSAA